MPHPVFTAHCRHLDALRAERMLDAATAASARHQTQEWWNGLVARAHGQAGEVKQHRTLFTFNKVPISTSNGLRQAFGQHVSSGVDA